jgi:hypothetical protein
MNYYRAKVCWHFYYIFSLSNRVCDFTLSEKGPILRSFLASGDRGNETTVAYYYEMAIIKLGAYFAYQEEFWTSIIWSYANHWAFAMQYAPLLIVFFSLYAFLAGGS